MFDRLTRIKAISCCGLLLLGMALANAAIGQEPKQEYAKEFRQSFKGVKPNPKDMTLIGPDADRCVKYEADGLRITLPLGYFGSRDATGVITHFPIRGDFEITVDYEILQEPAPGDADKSAASFQLQCTLNTPARNAATFTRRAFATDTDFITDYVAWRSISKELTGPSDLSSKYFKTTAKSGRLRLVRNGGTLLFLVAEGAEKEFKLLEKTTIRPEDVKNVQFFGTTGGKTSSLDVRVTHLTIRADALPAPMVTRLPQPQLNERVEYPFSEGIAKHPMLRFIGTAAESMASVQPEGLRFNVPASRNDTGSVGVESRLRLRGDFEITLEYELLMLPDPVPPLGAGVGLNIVLDTPDAFKAKLGRFRRPTGAVFSPSNGVLGPDGKEIPKYLFTPPADDKETKGHLRLVRAGTLLSYQVKEGGGAFRVIGKTQVGLADVLAVQVHCNTGWQPFALQARFPRLELRASEFPKTGTAPPLKQTKQPDLPAEGFYQDFRLKPELLPPLTFFGPDPMQVMRFEKEGLRITLPPIRKNPYRVGVELNERIKGDFEITATYEILKGSQPTEGNGVGVELFVATDSPTKDELNVFRLARVNEGEVHMTSRTTIEEGKPRYHNPRHFPTDCKSGRLKITRVGSEATLWAAEGDAKDFQELCREELGPEDVTVVRLNAFPGHRQYELDVRLKDLRVRGLRPNEAAALPPPPVPLDGPKTDGGKGWLAVTLVGGIAIPLLGVILFGFVLFLRRRQPLAPDKPPAEFLSVACPDCGKKLKVKAALAGKKVKCGQCGSVSPVPKAGALKADRDPA